MSSPAHDHDRGEPTVGIRDLSHRTSQVLSRVKAGERLVITDRGEPIAVMVPFRRRDMVLPATGYAPSGDPTWAARAAEDLSGFGE
ncbi:MAG TPA: type II toxin-antitoxin system prevent-host-death family antitoxin [Micromonosporaceae bacterium]|nr:type II toxin-antitoxin system prevent-host-death family antitoxin [Micromonosporaceae bacterium]